MASPSLYRRYRPQRFAELKGQDHVVRALRDAVAGGREGQAYLFSGPRGTGKTSSARILAKVLNCERPVDGEPCCECDSCRAVERGTSYDVHELDAASNNGVDAMRDLIEKAALGTPGRHKVYILDEVHMLSKAAEAALLKTLEEPPSHVVFVLATTDPQKVSDTIRSRTQHLRFHLLAADTLADHLRWVAADAGLDLDDDALEAALAQGAGSARDTLSALELIANAGGASADDMSFDEFLDAMIEHSPGQALTAMAHAIGAGHEPRALAEALVRHLRDGFLTLMAPELVQLSGRQLDDLASRALRLGPAALVRGIERLGEILVELRHAPDPRVLVEVALVQLTMAPPASDDDLGALATRLTKLEQVVAEGAPATPAGPAPVDVSTGRTALGGRARRPEGATLAAVEPAPTPPPPAPIAEPSVVDLDVIRAEWSDVVLPSLKGLVRALFTSAQLVSVVDGTVVMTAPNDTHRLKCEQHRDDVQRAWTATTGRTVAVEIAVGGGEVDDSSRPPAPPGAAGVDEPVDLDDLVDAAPGSQPTTIDRLAQAFPGAELIDRRD